MFGRVVVDESQGVGALDYDRIGTFPQKGAQLSTADLLYSGIVYAGLLVSSAGDGVGVNVAEGRVYDGGSQFLLEEVQSKTVAPYVPMISGRSVICLVVAQGLPNIADDQEGRYYERKIDPANPNSGTQQTVEDGYRTRRNKVAVTIIPGIEAVRPLAPASPVGAIAIAEILVTSSGIQSIEQRTDTQATRLDVLATNQKTLATAISLLGQAVDGLRIDLAATRADLLSSASAATLAALQVDVALIKDGLDYPSDGSPYTADRFMSYAGSDWDIATGTGNVDFSARVSEGIRFDWDAQNQFQLSAYNPNDPNLSLASTGILCPKFTAVPGITLDAATGTDPLGGVSVQTITVEHLVESRERVRYGTAFTVCNNAQWWRSGKFDPISGIFTAATGETYKAAAALQGLYSVDGVNHQAIRVQQFWKDQIEVPYDKYNVTQSVISGVVTAQSFLQHQERWVVGTDLAIKRWGDGAQIKAVFVECREDGTPDPKRVLGVSALDSSQFKAWPAWTSFDLPKPVFSAPLASDSGRARPYAIMWFTTGDVDVMTADGGSFLGGNRFKTTDGVYFVGDLTKDTCFQVRYARFDITNMPIRLGSWNLSGGIENIDVLAPMIVPGAASATFQVLVGSTWRSLNKNEAGSTFLNGTQALYDAQVLVTGTEWAMPIIDTSNSRVRLSRQKAHFDWIGKAWTPGVAGSQFKLRAVVAAWDAARHQLVPKLRYGASFGTLKSSVAAPTIMVQPGREVARADQCSAVVMEWTFDFSGSPLASNAQMKLEFIGDTNNYKVPFHVEWAVARKSA